MQNQEGSKNTYDICVKLIFVVLHPLGHIGTLCTLLYQGLQENVCHDSQVGPPFQPSRDSGEQGDVTTPPPTHYSFRRPFVTRP